MHHHVDMLLNHIIDMPMANEVPQLAAFGGLSFGRRSSVPDGRRHHGDRSRWVDGRKQRSGGKESHLGLGSHRRRPEAMMPSQEPQDRTVLEHPTSSSMSSSSEPRMEVRVRSQLSWPLHLLRQRCKDLMIMMAGLTLD